MLESDYKDVLAGTGIFLMYLNEHVMKQGTLHLGDIFLVLHVLIL